MMCYTQEKVIMALKQKRALEFTFEDKRYTAYNLEGQYFVMDFEEEKQKYFATPEQLIEQAMLGEHHMGEVFDQLQDWAVFEGYDHVKSEAAARYTWEKFCKDVIIFHEFDLYYQGVKYGISKSHDGFCIGPCFKIGDEDEKEKETQWQTYETANELLEKGMIRGRRLKEAFEEFKGSLFGLDE